MQLRKNVVFSLLIQDCPFHPLSLIKPLIIGVSLFSKHACQLEQLQYLCTSDSFKIVNEGLDLEDVVS